jgi:hypothetical protein
VKVYRKYFGTKNNSLDLLKNLCKDARTNFEMGKTLDKDKNPLDPAAVANPCGLMAKSFVNGNFPP